MNTRIVDKIREFINTPDPEANTNCLKRLRCPKCGYWGPLWIEIKAWSLFYDDGTEHTTEVEWEDESACACYGCQHHATVSEFTLRENGQ